MPVPTYRPLLAALAVVMACAVSPAPAAPRAGDPIKIGFSLPLTGSLAGAGRSAALAFEIWKEQVNARGGLLGRPVQLVSYDDRSDPALVGELYAKLVEADKVDLVVSSYGTAQIAAAMPFVIARKLLFLALFGEGVNDGHKYDRYFQIAPTGADAARAHSRAFLETAMTMDPKPRSIALVAAQTDRARAIMAGARETAGALGLNIVYDKSYSPRTFDFTPLVRAVQAADADVVFIASRAPDTAGLLRAAKEVGLKPRMLGGAMAGLGLAPVKAQLGTLLNGIVVEDVYVPEPTMRFPGIEDFLQKYRERAKGVAVDVLGLFLPPFAFAQMQILEQAITAVASLDQARLAEHIRNTAFATVVGEVKFGANGEWEKSRLLLVQYQGVSGGDIRQFAQPGVQVIIRPPELRSGKFIYPYADSVK